MHVVVCAQFRWLYTYRGGCCAGIPHSDAGVIEAVEDAKDGGQERRSKYTGQVSDKRGTGARHDDEAWDVCHAHM